MAHHDIDVVEIAEWLLGQGREALWTVDGEERLAGALSVPCTAEDLATALRHRGGQIRVHEPPEHHLAQGDLGRNNLDQVAERDDDARSFRLEWLQGPGQGEQWLLVEDTLAKTASEHGDAVQPRA
jgi:hypothetical protein